MDAILTRLDASEPPAQGVFYDGQLWDACSLVEKLIARAKTSILLIDNWVGAGTLDMLAKKRKGVAVVIVTSEHKDRRGNPRPTLASTDIAKFNAQYPTLAVQFNEKFHDRFLVLDDKEIYLIGASLKDLGKDISEKYPGKKRNVHFFENLSNDLQDGLGVVKGLSPRNLKYAFAFRQNRDLEIGKNMAQKLLKAKKRRIVSSQTSDKTANEPKKLVMHGLGGEVFQDSSRRCA